MQITDEYVLQYLENLKRWTEKNIKDTNVLSYLKNRFVDSKGISETYIRIKYDIQTRPVCRYCGKEVKFYFNRSKNIYAFSKHCSCSCSAKNPETFELKCKTKELHFGDKNYIKIAKKNNLNYLIFWNTNDGDNWLENVLPNLHKS